MDASERRQNIHEILKSSKQPISASTIAKQFHVSRQVIVGDIALLRASNVAISATPRGYILQTEKDINSNEILHTIACHHDSDHLGEELYILVDNGCGLIDVIVEHPVYGQISGQLQIFSRYDADAFLKKLFANKAAPLCNLTGGIHLHTISCPSEEAYQRILSLLSEKEILVKS